ncbi:MAG TPA: hypothetical protein VF444_14470 [Pseudonocardiaceae bacterium]
MLLDRAAQFDAGFDRTIFGEMLDNLSRYPDAELALGGVDVDALRTFFAEWIRELRTA